MPFDFTTTAVTEAESSESTVESAIESNATGPKRVTGDAGTVEQHSLQDQIAAEKFLKGKAAAQADGLTCLKHVKLQPPGGDA